MLLLNFLWLILFLILSFKIKEKITGETGNIGINNVEMMVKLKYLSNFWRALEMSLTNCEINIDLNWCKSCVIVAPDVANLLMLHLATFLITDAKLYVPVAILSNQDNAKLLEHLESCFKRTVNWNKYQSKISTERQKQYLDYLINPSFQRVNRLFLSSFEDEAQRTSLFSISYYTNNIVL